MYTCFIKQAYTLCLRGVKTNPTHCCDWIGEQLDFNSVIIFNCAKEVLIQFVQSIAAESQFSKIYKNQSLRSIKIHIAQNKIPNYPCHIMIMMYQCVVIIYIQETWSKQNLKTVTYPNKKMHELCESHIWSLNQPGLFWHTGCCEFAYK